METTPSANEQSSYSMRASTWMTRAVTCAGLLIPLLGCVIGPSVRTTADVRATIANATTRCEAGQLPACHERLAFWRGQAAAAKSGTIQREVRGVYFSGSAELTAGVTGPSAPEWISEIDSEVAASLRVFSQAVQSNAERALAGDTQAKNEAYDWCSRAPAFVLHSGACESLMNQLLEPTRTARRERRISALLGRLQATEQPDNDWGPWYARWDQYIETGRVRVEALGMYADVLNAHFTRDRGQWVPAEGETILSTILRERSEACRNLSYEAYSEARRYRRSVSSATPYDKCFWGGRANELTRLVLPSPEFTADLMVISEAEEALTLWAARFSAEERESERRYEEYRRAEAAYERQQAEAQRSAARNAAEQARDARRAAFMSQCLRRGDATLCERQARANGL
jgi:hypothetical protein